MKRILLLLLLPVLLLAQNNVEFFNDDFSGLRRGPFSVVVGAHTEYHYLHEAAPQGNWEVSTFRSGVDAMRAWQVRDVDDDRMMFQIYTNKDTHTHPMIVAGDSLWRDYTVTVKFSPQNKKGQSGMIFRYHNDRCNYFFGVKGDKAILKKVNHGLAFRKANETVLAETPCNWQANQWLTATVTVIGSLITAELDNGVKLTANDNTFSQGKVALMADIPTRYTEVRVTSTIAERQRIAKLRGKNAKIVADLQAANPKPVVWKKIKTTDFGVGRNVRFGDLNNDGQIDVLIGQVIHHGHKDRNSELSCMTAMTFDGEQLWQVGEQDLWKDNLTNDVAFQIHDINNDGKTEVIYTRNFELIVAEGATGKTLYKTSTPNVPDGMSPSGENKFEKILGDCLYFCDLRGKGYDSDIIIKDRYKHLWAFTDKLELM